MMLLSPGLVKASLLACLICASAGLASAEESAWDVTQARGNTRVIDFTTDVGTWMSVDVSPDGKWLVFDLLSQIYRVPVTGGDAECLTEDSGIALNYHPRYSPDGRTIAFVSDRRGQSNLWVMDADGRHPRPVFLSETIRAGELAWTPDSNFIVVNQSVEEGKDEGGLWMYPLTGGQGQKLVPGVSWPSVSRDGKYVYYETRGSSSGASVPGMAGAAPSLIGGSRQIGRLSLADGERLDMTSGIEGLQTRMSSGGAIAPEVSPDGRWLAFSRRVPGGTISYKGHRYGPRSALWLLDLNTGAERMILDPIEQDMGEGVKTLRVLPGYAWSGDGRSIFISQGGKLHRVDIGTGQVTTIPFRARVHRVISQQAVHKFRIDDGPFEARYTRWMTASPDNRRLAFQTIGKIWVQDLPAGKPRRLTPISFEPSEYAPVWSPDGRWIAFTSWDEKAGGHLWKISVPSGKLERLTREAGEYANPAWSPDGKEIVVARGSGATLRGRSLADNPWYDLIRVALSGGQPTTLVRVPRPGAIDMENTRDVVRPTYGTGGRIFYQLRNVREHTNELLSVRVDGSDKKLHLSYQANEESPDSAVVPSADDMTPSPDGQWVAFTEMGNVFIAPLSLGGTAGPALLTPAGTKAISQTGGLDPRWRDAHTLEFGSGGKYFVYHLGATATETAEVHLGVARDIPTGSIALRNARIVTLADPQVIEHGTIVVRGSRIICVGTCPVEHVDRVIDVDGKTIVPGFVDMHAHHYDEYLGVTPPHGADNAVYLAYGITTTLDPFVSSRDIFSTAELVEAGKVIGPRVFSTGEGMTGDNPKLPTYEVTEAVERRLQSWGAVTVKQYAQPTREQRQWTVEAARKLGLNVTSEGEDLNFDVGMVMDGQTGVEHMLSYMPIYPDVARFFGAAGFCYSPTFAGAGPGPWSQEYWWAKSDLWADRQQQQWVPWRKLWPAARRPVHRPDTDYSFPMAAQGMADIIEAGGCGVIGGHDQQPGLSSHWNIWAAATAMAPLEALKVASLYGARFLGADQDIGSLEPGKLADLVVLNSNPLERIENTADISYVMKGGTLYEGLTLDEVWPKAQPFGTYNWRNPDMFRVDDKPVDDLDRRH